MTTTSLDMIQFGCVSCMHAIERMGRRVSGVEEIHVDLANKAIHITHADDDDSCVDEVVDLVNRIGHEARRKP